MLSVIGIIVGFVLIVMLPRRFFGGRGGRRGAVRIRVRYGPSLTAQAATHVGKFLLKVPGWAVTYWYVSVPLVALSVISYLIYSIFG